MYKDFIKKLRDKAVAFENNEYPMEVIVQDYRDCARLIEYLSEQPQVKKCADCTRRKFYQQGYQDGLNVNADKWIPCKVKNTIDTIISHNEIVALWYEEPTDDIRYHKLIWRGMAWDIPQVYKECEFEKIFGTVPESIVDADTINISIKLSEEARLTILPQPYKKEGAE